MKRWKRILPLIVATVVTATITVQAADKTPQPIPGTPNPGTPAGKQVTPFDPVIPTVKPSAIQPKALDASKSQDSPSRPTEKHFTLHVPVKLSNLYPNIEPFLACGVKCYPIGGEAITYQDMADGNFPIGPISRGTFSGIVTVAFDIDNPVYLDKAKCPQWEYGCYIYFKYGEVSWCNPEVGKTSTRPECNVISGNNKISGTFP